MAVAPLFIADIATLKAELRLSGSTQSDTTVLIERAVQEVRAGFYDSLGEARVAQIVAMAVEENPTSSDGILRMKAANTEVKWTRLRLIQTLPSLFMDSSGNTDQIWNEEGLTRDASATDIKRLSDRLENEINEALADLDGTVEPGSASVAVIGPQTTPAKPGESVFPWGIR